MRIDAFPGRDNPKKHRASTALNLPYVIRVAWPVFEKAKDQRPRRRGLSQRCLSVDHRHPAPTTLRVSPRVTNLRHHWLTLTSGWLSATGLRSFRHSERTLLWSGRTVHTQTRHPRSASSPIPRPDRLNHPDAPLEPAHTTSGAAKNPSRIALPAVHGYLILKLVAAGGWVATDHSGERAESRWFPTRLLHRTRNPMADSRVCPAPR